MFTILITIAVASAGLFLGDLFTQNCMVRKYHTLDGEEVVEETL